MKRFLIRVLLFFAIVFSMDQLMAYCLQAFRPSDYELFIEAKKEFFKQDSTYELLIFGDSHIADALDPRMIEANCGMSSFNLGIYHTTPFDTYYIVLSALENLNVLPKYAVLGTNPTMFEKPLAVGRYTDLIADVDHNYFLEAEEGLDFSLLSKTLRERYLIKSAMNSLLGKKYKPTREVENVFNGHLKFFNQMESAEWDDFDSLKISSEKNAQIHYFQKTIELLENRGIKVMVVNPPIWEPDLIATMQTESFFAFRHTLDSIAAKNKIKVFNSSHIIYEDLMPQAYFLNSRHVNYQGSKIFTEEFCDFINRIKD